MEYIFYDQKIYHYSSINENQNISLNFSNVHFLKKILHYPKAINSLKYSNKKDKLISPFFPFKDIEVLIPFIIDFLVSLKKSMKFSPNNPSNFINFLTFKIPPEFIFSMKFTPFNYSIFQYLFYIQNDKALINLYELVYQNKLYFHFKHNYFEQNEIDVAFKLKDRGNLENLLNFFVENAGQYDNINFPNSITLKNVVDILSIDYQNVVPLIESRLIPSFSQETPRKSILKKIKIQLLDTNTPKTFKWIPQPTKEEFSIPIEVKFFNIPHLFSYKNNSFFKAIADLPADHQIYNSPIITLLLKARLKQFPKRIYYFDLIIFLIYFIIFTLNAIFLVNTKKFVKAFIATNILVIIFAFLFLIQEIIQFFLNKKNKLLKLNSYFDFWNIIDWIIISLGFTCGGLGIHYNKESNVKVNMIFSATLLIVWIRMFSYTMINKKMSFLIRMILEVFKEMRYFIIILFFLILELSFSSNFFILSNFFLFSFNFFFYIAYVLKSGQSFSDVFKIIYKLTLGDFEDFWKEDYPEYFQFTLFLFATVVLMIILLNLLIVIINETYDKVDAVSLITQNREKALKIKAIELLLEFIFMFSFFNRTDEKAKELYFFIAKPKDFDLVKSNEEKNENKMRSRIEKIEDIVQQTKKYMEENNKKLEENMNKKLEENNKKLEENMNKKLEENNKKLEENNKKLEENNKKLEENMNKKFEEIIGYLKR